MRSNLPKIVSTKYVVVQRVYDIVTGIRFTKKERAAFQAKSALGKGPAVQIDTLRVSIARQYVAEKENKIVFLGDSKYNIPGLLNKSGINSVSVADGAAGTGAAKKLWINKTPKEILEDLLIAKDVIESGNVFSAKALVLTPSAMARLRRPYSDANPVPLITWLKENITFDKILVSNQMATANNGLGVDCFLMMDDSPEVAQIVITSDLSLGEPIYDILGTSEQVVEESIAGTIIRHPSAIYVGKGI